MEKDEAYAVHLVNSMNPALAPPAAAVRNPQVKGTVAPSTMTSLIGLFTRKESLLLPVPAPAPAPAASAKLQWPANGFTVSNDPKVAR